MRIHQTKRFTWSAYKADRRATQRAFVLRAHVGRHVKITFIGPVMILRTLNR